MSPTLDPAAQLLFDSFSDGVLVCDPGGVIVAANPRAGQCLQCEPAKMVGLPLRQVLAAAQSDSESPRVDTRTLADGRRIVLLRERVAAWPWNEPEFRRIIENMQDAYFRANLEGRLTMASESAAQLYGYPSAAAMVGMQAAALYGDPAERERMLAELGRTGTILDRRGEGVRRDGSRFWVSLNARFYHDADGVVRGVEGFVRNIAEHRRMELALQASEQRFRRIIENVQDAYLCSDATGHLIMVSPSAVRLFGYPSVEAMIGLPSVQLYRDAAERDRMLAKITRAGEVLDSIGQARRQDGSVFWISLNGRFLRDAQGRLTSAEAFVRDVTERRQAEEALRESERRFRQMFEGSRAVMLLLDPDTMAIIEANPAAAQFYGYSQAALCAMTIPDINLQSREEIRANMERVGAGEVDHFAFTHRLANGELRNVEVRTSRVEIGGRPRLFSVIHDVTERTKVEAALRDSEFFLARSQAVARIGSYKFDIAAGSWICSPALNQVFGIRDDYPKTVEGWLRLIAPVDRPMMEQHLLEHVVAHGHRFDREYRIVRVDDQQERWVHGLGELEIDEAGRPLRMIGTIQDVTERRRAEEALLRTQVSVDLARDAVFWMGPEGRILSVNQAACSELGYTREELQQLSIPDIDPNFPRERWAAHWRDTRKLGARTIETVHRAKDGRLIPVEVSINYINHGGEEFHCAIVRDITDRKRAEAERLDMERRFLHGQKLESLGVLAGGIAHDFNNLLMAVLGNLDQALWDLPADSPARTAIGQSMNAARRAADLTRQMLAYSGRGSFAVQRIDLGALVQENVHLFRACISKLVSLEVEIAAHLPAISADPGQVQQVVMNLITNASEAIGDRPGVLRVAAGVTTCDAAALKKSRVAELPAPGAFVFLEVADTGCGMDEATQQKLFDPFFTTKFTGRGLGMAALLGIIRGHGGAIFVDSEVECGTTVRVLFPVQPAEDSTRPPAAPAAAGGLSAPSGGCVLLVDDEDMVRAACRNALRRLGWRVLEARDGPGAVELFQQHATEVTCVILDLSMPRMSGVEVFHALRAIRPDVRILLTSGFSSDQRVVAELTSAGLAGFIQKPYTGDTLGRALQGALQPR